MWAKELCGFADHVPETEEYGVASYVYRARLPSGRVVLRPEAVPDAMTQLYDIARVPQCQPRAQLIDAITARLICTCRGSGTRYGISTDGDDPKRIFSVPTGSPVVLRGSLWPEHPLSGLLHRSPPIEGTDETRLVLVLDPVFDAEEAT